MYLLHALIASTLLRERTENIRLETTYCRACGFNHYRNIGTLTCVSCGKQK